MFPFSSTLPVVVPTYVEKGEYRTLEPKEEAEFQELMYGSPERKLEGKLIAWPKLKPEPTD